MTCLVCFLQNAVTSIAKRKECCVGESQGIEERDSFQEAHEKKKTCDRKRYKADPESKKDSMKAQYWLDPESKKESAKAQYWLSNYGYHIWWPSMCLLNLAIQVVASMAAKTCSLGFLCKL